jgi:ferredoxin
MTTETERRTIMAAKLSRKIVKIDEEKCNGCGLCVPSCEEGAIEIVDGVARLVADNLCDGLGNCLGVCPEDAITIEERPADPYEEQEKLPCGCPGTMTRKLEPYAESSQAAAPSRLGNWPVQIRLLPEQGDIWDKAHVLVSADCVAHAVGGFHERLLAGRTLAVGCPKLDDIEFYTEKLTRIFASNEIESVTVARMEVPCCAGIVAAVRTAVENSGKIIPIREVTVGIEGDIMSERLERKEE